METLQAISLVAATVAMGIGAGVYLLYSFVLMPALGRTDDRTFVSAFQQIDTAVVGPFLAVFFVGPLVLTVLAGALQLGDAGAVLALVGAALALQIVVVAVTVVGNVPRNDAIKAAGEPATTEDAGALRRAFDEAAWSRNNAVRSAAATLATACLAWATWLAGG